MVREYANMYIFQDSKVLSQSHTFPLTCREMLRNVIILKKKKKLSTLKIRSAPFSVANKNLLFILLTKARKALPNMTPYISDTYFSAKVDG